MKNYQIKESDGRWVNTHELMYSKFPEDRRRVLNWVRYRFNTKSTDDERPLIFDPHYPWWCSGYAADMSFAVIVAYLPATEDIKKYWDDAFNIETTEEEEIRFSDRFPKPSYFVEY